MQLRYMFPPFDSPRHSGTLNELKQLKLVKIIVLETSDYFNNDCIEL